MFAYHWILLTRIRNPSLRWHKSVVRKKRSDDHVQSVICWHRTRSHRCSQWEMSSPFNSIEKTRIHSSALLTCEWMRAHIEKVFEYRSIVRSTPVSFHTKWIEDSTNALDWIPAIAPIKSKRIKKKYRHDSQRTQHIWSRNSASLKVCTTPTLTPTPTPTQHDERDVCLKMKMWNEATTTAVAEAKDDETSTHHYVWFTVCSRCLHDLTVCLLIVNTYAHGCVRHFALAVERSQRILLKAIIQEKNPQRTAYAKRRCMFSVFFNSVHVWIKYRFARCLVHELWFSIVPKSATINKNSDLQNDNSTSTKYVINLWKVHDCICIWISEEAQLHSNCLHFHLNEA